MYELFADRRAAGREVARCLGRYGDRADAVVLGLPRGGIPVAYEVALSLDAPLDAFVVRKLRVPWREELAMGALASGGACVLNGDVIDALAIDRRTIDEVTARERREPQREGIRWRSWCHVTASWAPTVHSPDTRAASTASERCSRWSRTRSCARLLDGAPVRNEDVARLTLLAAIWGGSFIFMRVLSPVRPRKSYSL